MIAHAIHIAPNGGIQCLHTDAIDLTALGHCHNRRASWIDWHADHQRWEVRLDPHAADPVFHHPSRTECLRWEKDYFLRLFTTPTTQP